MTDINVVAKTQHKGEENIKDEKNKRQHLSTDFNLITV